MQPEPANNHRRLSGVPVIALAILAVGLASIAYLVPPRTTKAALGHPLPSLSPKAVADTSSCPSTELQLTGVLNECVTIGRGSSCPAGSFDHARVIQLHGTKHDFIIYIEVNGRYRGPGVYPLEPWPTGTLGVADDIAKVALREARTGQLWESSAGSLVIDRSEEWGWVYAGLGASKNSPVQVELNIAGWWSCS